MVNFTAAVTADVVMGEVDHRVAMTSFAGIGRLLKMKELRLRYGAPSNGRSRNQSPDLLAG